MNFFDLALTLNHAAPTPTCPTIPHDIIKEYIWPMLSYRHQGRCGYPISKMNDCLDYLPKKYEAIGPKIIYKKSPRSTTDPSLENSNSDIVHVKFIYRVKHSKKNDNLYINIIEWVQLTRNDFQQCDANDWHEFNNHMRKLYAHGIQH